MYIIGSTGDDVNEYNLSTSFDVATAVYSQNFSVSAQDLTFPTGIAFNKTALRCFFGLVLLDVSLRIQFIHWL
jgi:hypothetical protein